MVKNLSTIDRGTKIRLGRWHNDDQADNTIVINASDTPIQVDQPGLYMKPIRSDPSNNTLMTGFDPETYEILNTGLRRDDIVPREVDYYANIGNTFTSTLQFTADNALITEGRVGISNVEPVHTLDVGSKFYVDENGANVLTVLGDTYVQDDLVVGGSLNVIGTVTAIDTVNTVIKDAIIELGKGNVSSDMGIIMDRTGTNVALGYRDTVDEFVIAYTGSSATSSTITPSSELIDARVHGRLHVNSNLTIDTDTFHVDAVRDRVGINTLNPQTDFDVVGKVAISSNLSVDTNTLHVDASVSRVGINTLSPSTDFHVEGETYVSGNVTVDTDTFHVDTVNDRVGINTLTPTTDFHVEGDAFVSGNVDVDTDLTVTGNAYMSSNIIVTGNADVLTDLNVTGNGYIQTDLTVTGNAYMTSNIVVTGNADVQTDLNVTGNAYMSSNIVVTGNADVQTDLNVTGNAYMSSNIVVTGNADVHTDLNVIGNTYISSNAVVTGNVDVQTNLNVATDAIVTGNVDVQTDLNVTGNVYMYSNALVTGNADVQTDLNVTGNAYMYSNAVVTGNVDVQTDLNVIGNGYMQTDLTVTGNAYMSSNIVVTGNADVLSDLNVTGNGYMQTDLTVTGNAYMTSNIVVTGNADVRTDLNVTGNAYMSSNAVVTGNVDVQTDLNVIGNGYMQTDLTVTGNAYMSSNIVITGNTDVQTDLNVTGNAYMSSNIVVTGNADVQTDLNVTGNAYMLSNIVVTGNADVQTDLNVTGNAYMYSNAVVTGNADILTDLNVIGNGYMQTDLTVTGNAYMSSNIVVTGNADVQSELNVTGNVFIDSNLVVTNNVHAATYYGDGGILSNVTLQVVSDHGNVTSNTIQFSNPTTGLTTTANVEVGSNISVAGLADPNNKYLPMVNHDGFFQQSPVYVTSGGKYVISAAEAEFLGNITLSGNNTVVSSTSVTIEDRIFGIGANNAVHNLDTGLMMEHKDDGEYANVALIYHADEHRFSISYTQNTFTDNHILHFEDVDHQMLIDLRGNVLVQHNLVVNETLDVTSDFTVGAASNLFVDVSTSRVGINEATPDASLDVNGDVLIQSTVDASSKTSGALRVSGGVGVVGNVYATRFVGDGAFLENIASNLEQITENGNVTTNTIEFTNASAALVATGHVGIANTAPIHDLDVGSNLFVEDTGSNVVHVIGNVYATRFIGDGAFLENIASNLEQITENGNVTTNTIELTNASTSLVTIGSVGIANTSPIHDLDVGSNLFVEDTGSNVVHVTGNIYATRFVGDGAFLENIASNLHEITTNGNVTTNTVQFTNAATALITTGKVGISTSNPDANLHVTGNAYVSSNVEVAGNVIVDGGLIVNRSGLTKKTYGYSGGVIADGTTPEINVVFDSQLFSAKITAHLVEPVSNISVLNLDVMGGTGRNIGKGFVSIVGDQNSKHWDSVINTTDTTVILTPSIGPIGAGSYGISVEYTSPLGTGGVTSIDKDNTPEITFSY